MTWQCTRMFRGHLNDIFFKGSVIFCGAYITAQGYGYIILPPTFWYSHPSVSIPFNNVKLRHFSPRKKALPSRQSWSNKQKCPGTNYVYTQLQVSMVLKKKTGKITFLIRFLNKTELQAAHAWNITNLNANLCAMCFDQCEH